MVYDIEHYLLKHKAMNQEASPEQFPQSEALDQQLIDPDAYLGLALDLYRKDKADYRGRRNEDQEFIAEYSAEEADEHFDANLLGIFAMSKMFSRSGESMTPPDEDEQRELTLGNLADGVSMKDMRDAWRQLWVGFNILTHRLRRDSDAFQQTGLPEVFDMPDASKKLLRDKLFNNFQDLNALRFGAIGSGVRRYRYVPDMDGGEPTRLQFDPDVARTNKEMAGNAIRRKYVVSRDKKRPAVHAAGKMTPDEFVSLRRQYPEVDMDRFANDAAFLKDMAKQYEAADEE